jgi:hypothetical protein
LPVTRIESAPPQRILEPHDLAFNTILDPRNGYVDSNAKDALARALNMDISEAIACIGANRPLPVARCHSRQEAELIGDLVRRCGLAATVVPDQDLELGRILARARRVTPANGSFEVKHSSGVMVVPLSEIMLIVVGFLRSGRVDYSEAAGRGRSNEKENNIKDSFEFQSERALLDVYTGSLDQSFRIAADSFDYSGLVQPLSFRAEMNFQSAINALRRAAPAATIDHDFQRVRGLLARVWPERSHTESRGLRRTGIALRSVPQASVLSDNRDQFERYSRLMFLSTCF